MAEEKKPDLSKFLATTLPTTQSPGYKVIYVNANRMAVSPWDVRIVVGQVSEVSSSQVNQDEATLMMSPQMAKQFLRNLEKTINSYEKLFGEITEPSIVIEKARKEKEAASQGGKPALKRLKP